VQISTVIARLSGDSEDLLDDYRFWRERDPELKSRWVIRKIRTAERDHARVL
jgi:hypothetical protein